MMKRFRSSLAIRCVAAVIAGLIASNGASAFFFKGWPGDGLPRERTLLPPSTQVTEPPGVTEWLPPNPPYNPPPPPTENPPPFVEVPTDGNPPGVPEPTTAVLAAFGIGVAALSRRKRGRKRIVTPSP